LGDLAQTIFFAFENLENCFRFENVAEFVGKEVVDIMEQYAVLFIKKKNYLNIYEHFFKYNVSSNKFALHFMNF
jgi:hypothetical protein